MELKDLESWVTIVGSAVAAGAAIFATFKALTEWRRATDQRKDELTLRAREFRHKQALLAREMVREVMSDKKARTALAMLDWLWNDYIDEEGITHRVKRDEIQYAMRANPKDCSDKEEFIRVRFEALYDHIEQLERLIQLEIVDFADVQTAFRYYMVRLLRPTIWHEEFLKYYDYPGAEAFIRRYLPFCLDSATSKSVNE